MSKRAEVRIAYLPYSESLSPPPTASVIRILHILESIQSSLEDSILVAETRNGGRIPSGLYTYSGFVESLTFYTRFGVDEKFFFLGDEAEIGIANLALFLSKMMDTIAYERCEPNQLSCGMPPLDETFAKQNIRVQCSPNSSDDGKECPIEYGCACILGILQYHFGIQSDYEKYSSADFCETNTFQSICSRRTDQGTELRWITAMAYWVLFVQQYKNGNGWSYLNELHKFVSGGMLDVSFLDQVRDLSVLGTEAATASVRFKANFFKAMVILSEGHGMYQSMAQRKTSSPSKRNTSLQTSSPIKRNTSAPTPEPMTSSPSNPPTGSITFKPTQIPTKLSVNPTNSPFPKKNTLYDFLFAASTPPTISSVVPEIGANSLQPYSSEDDISRPTEYSVIATTAVNNQQPVVSPTDDVFPLAISPNTATPAKGNGKNQTVSYSSTDPVDSTSDIKRWHWQYGELASYTRNNASDRKAITGLVIVSMLLTYMFLLINNNG